MGIITFRSLLAANDPALAKSQVLPKLRLGNHERETDEDEEEVHVELRGAEQDWSRGEGDGYFLSYLIHFSDIELLRQSLTVLRLKFFKEHFLML